jgi:hypothetical protein
MNSDLNLGIYEHFKGGKYEVVGFAKHSETLEKMVLYKHLGDPPAGGELWVRPLAMFLETVERPASTRGDSSTRGGDGKTFPRFKYIGPK